MALTIDELRCPQNHRCPLIPVCPVGAISQQGDGVHKKPEYGQTV